MQEKPQSFEQNKEADSKSSGRHRAARYDDIFWVIYFAEFSLVCVDQLQKTFSSFVVAFFSSF